MKTQRLNWNEWNRQNAKLYAICTWVVNVCVCVCDNKWVSIREKKL